MRTTRSGMANVGRRQRRGGVLPLVAICMVALIGVLALAFDFGYFYYTTLQLQNAADSAALAGAGKLGTGQSAARTAAITFAGHNDAAGQSVLLTDNPANAAQGDVVLGVFDKANHTFTPTTTSPNAVKVVARRTNESARGPVSTFFGQIFGIESVQMQRSAIAIAEGGTRGPAIVLLAPDGIGLKHTGDGKVTVLGGIQINSNYKEALHKSGNGTLTADSYDVVGKIYNSSSANLITGTKNEGADALADPYASLPEPNVNNYPVASSSKFDRSRSTTLWPGRYKGGIVLGGGTSTVYTMMPGVYIIEGGGFMVTAPCTVNAAEVMIYNAGDNVAIDGTLGIRNADQFYLSSDSTLTWSPPTSGTYAGICLFQHRALSDKKIQISGNGNSSITGVVYGASAEMQITGESGSTFTGGGFVVKRLEISGNGTFIVGGGAPGGGGYDKVYLVW